MEKIKPFYVLDVPVYPYTMDGAVNFLNSQVKNKKQTFVVTANAEIIMMCQKDAEYKKIVCQNACRFGAGRRRRYRLGGAQAGA